MNKIKRFVSLALVLCMVVAFLPVGVSAAEDASYAYNIVHVDAGRKYFTPGELKAIIDNAAEAGFNQVELYLSDNQGFRFALDDMSLITDYGTYDLTPALGDGYSDGTGKAPCGSGMYLTEEEMDDIIAYANGKGIDIVPCINVPGHMGAILEAFTGFRYKKSSYSVSKSSIDLSNQEAVAFALALTEKYASYFASRGCKFYNVGADEYANDLSTMGFEGMGTTLYTKFVQFLNDAAAIITDLGMTPRAFNDGFYYGNYSIAIEPDKAYEICYWSSGWGGYNVAPATTIANKGHKLINTDGAYYWVLGNTSWQCSASKASGFDYTNFSGGKTISQPAGAMFCIWCDTGDADTAASVISKTESVIDAFGSVLPQVENLVGGEVVGNVTLTEGGVSVTASGLTGLTVSEAEAPSIEGAAKAVAWNVAPETADGPYTGEAEVSVSVPGDFNTERLGAFVVNADGSVTKLTGAYADGFYTYTCPHFSETGIYEAEPAAEELEERTITVSVGDTATDIIEGGDYTAEIDESRLDKTIALVGATFENVITGTAEAVKAATLTSGGTYIIGNGSGRYMVVNGSSISSTTDFEAATKFTVTGSNGNWKIQAGNYYLRHANNSLTASTTNSNNTWSYDGTRFYYTATGNWGGTTTYRLNTNRSGTWRVNTDSSSRQGAAYTVTPATTTPTTTVTFTGLKVGTTYVTVGNVRYTINVLAEDLSKVTPLTVEYWITNNKVTAEGATSKSISAADVNSVGGKLISELIPATGTMNNNDMGYWKTTRLADGSHQTTGSGVNMTMKGSDFTHIRYYGGSWAYSADGRTWTNVVDGDQIVAYYMQTTKVTNEVTTQVVDWGEAYGNYFNDANYILVDYAVKYESGERTPNAFPIRNTTQKFHCASNTENINYGNVVRDSATGIYYRNLWSIRPVETAEYDVYMITLTPTADNAKTYLASTANGERENQTGFYAGTEKVVWVDDMANLGAFADESLHYTSISGDVTLTVGGEPGVPELEIYNRHGMLVTYYVRAKATEDALTVHYMDENEGVEFYSYNIAVKEGTYFNANIGLANPWKGNLANGSVENFYGRTQYVSSDLATLSQVGAQYLYSEYECVKVERSADGKHVYLYYTFDPTVSFVIDFSLPMELTATDLSEKLKGVSIQDIAFSGSSYTTYGRLTDNGTSITYQPVKIMNGTDYFTLLVTTDRAVDGILDEASNKIAFRVYIVPATTMHYEESFITLNGFEIDGTPNAGSQETELAGNKKQNYGFTTGYTAAGMTNGTEAVSVINGTTANATAEFTFTGDGVEVYVNAAKDTGTMLALFHQNKNGSESLTKLYQVDTAAQSGSSAVTGGQDVDSYNLPVISVNGLTYGTYRVKLMHTGAGHDLGAVRLDGFRVFNPLGNTSAKAYHVSEHNPEYVEVRDEVLTGLNVSAGDIDNEEHYIKTVVSQVFAATDGSLNGALFLSGSAEMDAADLLNNGPKNELFLRKGESVSFDLGSAKAQIGLKALNGQVSYTINGKAASIATSADMFYGEYTGLVTIVNTGDNILSVTKLKLVAGENLQAVSEKLVKHALQCMGIIQKPVCPFADVAEDSYYYDAVMWAVKEGITSGADATHFLPDALCQRAQVVTFLWRAAGSPEPETNVNPFVDVTEDSFFYKAVLWAAEKGITSGVDQNHFAPFAACSRAQVVTFLWRANGCPESDAAIPFADVAEGSYYEPAVKWAVENGITSGMSANIFGVNTTCNRAQIVSFLYRAK